MEELLTKNAFIERLTYYLKATVFINKGTTNEKMFKYAMSVHDRYKNIELRSETEISAEDDKEIRIIIKKINLSLKTNPDGTQFKITDPEKQLQMLTLPPHPSIPNDDIESMYDYAQSNTLQVIQKLPLVFSLRENKHRSLMWQYTRLLFYISQYVISEPIIASEFVSESESDNEEKLQLKATIRAEAEEFIMTILKTVNELEACSGLESYLASDKFLSKRLVGVKINDKNIRGARDKLMEIFASHGVDLEGPMPKMVNAITDKMTDIDNIEDNPLQSIIGIAKDISSGMQSEYAKNRDEFQDQIKLITKIFRETVSTADKEELTPELREIIESIPISNENFGGETSDGTNVECDDLFKKLETIIKDKGIGQEELQSVIRQAESSGGFSKEGLVAINSIFANK